MVGGKPMIWYFPFIFDKYPQLHDAVKYVTLMVGNHEFSDVSSNPVTMYMHL